MATHISSSPRKLATTFALSLSLIIVPGLASSAQFEAQSSKRAAEWGFDFVEEFDGLQDWVRTGANEMNVHDSSRMPKLENGGDSAWGYYSNWGGPAPLQPWIGGGKNRPVWRGTKSLSIDLGGTSYGPSRFGLQLGQGYKDFNLFYMVWIPKNMFPTSCEGSSCTGGGPIGTYTEGRPYTYYASWKFNTFNTDCGSAHCTGMNDTYGHHRTIPSIVQYNYGANPGLTISNGNAGTSAGSYTMAADGSRNLNGLLGDWFGVEFKIRNIGNDTQYEMDIWFYDKNGNATHAMRSKAFPITAGGKGVWDMFFFGGNNANSWSWGPTMQSHYYIDDVIIDHGSKGQIGPRYFKRIGSSTTDMPPAPPANPSGAQINK